MFYRIKINSTQEMFTARKVLVALGYDSGVNFTYATSMEDWTALHVNDFEDGSPNDICRGRINGWTQSIIFHSLTDFLDAKFPAQTPAQKELARLEEEVSQLNKQIAALKATI